MRFKQFFSSIACNFILPIIIVNLQSVTVEGASPLWFAKPANEWEEALPIGNGRLAAMVFGGIEGDRIQFNEESLWSGKEQDADNPKALAALSIIRQNLFDGNYAEAEKLTYEYLIPKGPGACCGKSATADFGCYQCFGDLFIKFPDVGCVQNYRRELDLNTAIQRVQYSIDNVNYTREYFISAVDQVCLIHLSCDKPGCLHFTTELNREEKALSLLESENILFLKGELNSHDGLKFTAGLKVIPQNGRLSASDHAITVNGADSALLILSAATSYQGKPHEEIVKNTLLLASQKSFSELKNAHISEYQSYFQRASLTLEGPDLEIFPTDLRLQRVKEGHSDPKLLAQYFDFGRYLLISSSRPGCLPANLQGKWAYQIQTPWNCDYHTNINLQMNYWAAEVANLSDCHIPLFEFIASLQKPGMKTAKIQYGANGWVVHHATNIWGYTTMAEDARWGLFPSGSGWLCRHLWEHYAFNGDESFLKWAYPIMKGAAEFYLDFLVVEPKHKTLVTCPSSSPENQFYGPDGNKYTVCMGPSMDIEIIWDLFTHTSQAAKILGTDPEFVEKLDSTKSKLAPLKIGKHGQLQEWMEDFEEPEPGHRHISHLFALYPGIQISHAKTPELAKAARKSLERRLQYGGGHTGWSQAWIINFWARLKDGEKAYRHLNELLITSTFPNLFDNHPPFSQYRKPLFQIDGNFGAAAGMAEMLLQSHEDEISLLPALPAVWKSGSFSGLRARGGVEIDLSWDEGQITALTLKASKAGHYKIRFPDCDPDAQEKILIINLEANVPYEVMKK